MGLTDQAIRDAKTITSNLNDFGVMITLTSPSGPSLVINGLHTKHHLAVDTEGNIVNSKKASLSFSESLLISPYPCRNNFQEVDLKNHLASVKDSTGIIKNYLIQQWFPDEAIGLIVCVLEDIDNA